MNIEKELENHIITEFVIHNSGPVMLTETRGRINNIDEIVKYFANLVQPQVFEAYKLKTEIMQPYSGEINIDTFFKKYRINISFEPSVKTNYNGGISPDSIFQNIEGKWICVPDIKLNIKANNILDALKTFYFAIGHELTHAYDLFQYAIKTGQDPWYSIDRNQYFKIRDAEQFYNGNPKAIANMLYHLNRMERNAYIAQIRQELMAKKDKVKDNKTVFELIKETESWKKFLLLGKNIVNIFNIKNNDLQNEILQAVNDLMNKKFTTYNQVKKYFINRWNKWKHAYLINASKIAYDVYVENNGEYWMDWGIGNDETFINDENNN